MTFQEIFLHFLAGEKIRRKSHEVLTYWVRLQGDYVINCYDNHSPLCADEYNATDWELYKEPEPEKTLGQIVYEIVESVFCNSGIAWNDRQEIYKDRYEMVAQILEPKIIQRHRESLPKIEGKTAGQLLIESFSRFAPTIFNAEHYSEISADLRNKIEYEAATFLSAYQLAPPELKDQSAVERLYNSGFENICLEMNIAGSYRCSFDALGREFVGGGATSEKAAANAIVNFKYFITGL